MSQSLWWNDTIEIRRSSLLYASVQHTQSDGQYAPRHVFSSSDKTAPPKNFYYIFNVVNHFPLDSSNQNKNQTKFSFAYSFIHISFRTSFFILFSFLIGEDIYTKIIMENSLSLTGLLKKTASQFPDRRAISASGKFDLTHARLQDLVDHAASLLHAAGIGHNDVVALTFPNTVEVINKVSIFHFPIPFLGNQTGHSTRFLTFLF